jgi:hypothetical protein
MLRSRGRWQGSRLGVGPGLHDELTALPARYDGKGRLCGCRARRPRSPARVVHLAQVAVLSGRGTANAPDCMG